MIWREPEAGKKESKEQNEPPRDSDLERMTPSRRTNAGTDGIATGRRGLSHVAARSRTGRPLSRVEYSRVVARFDCDDTVEVS
jgi:hypothetical protein